MKYIIFFLTREHAITISTKPVTLIQEKGDLGKFIAIFGAVL